MCYAKPGPRCATHALAAVMERTGMQADRTPEGVENMMAFLQTRGALEAIAKKLTTVKKGSYYYKELMGTYKAALNGYSRKMAMAGKTFRPIPQAPSEEELNQAQYLTDLPRIYAITRSLYAYPRSPLYERARALEASMNTTITGYYPGEPATHRISTAEVAKRTNVDLTKLPDGYVSYDIETDTSHGYGLRPHRTQITELVLTTKEETLIFSGDEKHILQSFADFMNSQDEPVTLTGWNISGFDNAFLDVRAKAHPDLRGWGGSLSDSTQKGGYAAVGGHTRPQSLTWAGSNGVVHKDEDAMLSYLNAPGISARTAKLKPTAASLGMNPIELDRSKLHEYSQEERNAYVASDGLATLVCLSNIAR